MFSALARFFSWLDRWALASVGEKYNPFAKLGALAITHLLFALITGVLLLPFYDVNMHSAYASVAHMVRELPLSAGLIHSLHRYASDAAVFFAFLHFLRILANKAFHGPRVLSWMTGLFSWGLLGLIGWTGYWLAWDQTGFWVAQFSARLLDGIPLLGTALESSLLLGDASNSKIFFVVFFVHMLLPLALFIGLWIHVSRVNRPQFVVPLRYALGALVFLAGLSMIAPASIGGAPSPLSLSHETTLDVFYLLPLPLFERVSAPVAWMALGFSSFLLVLVPWLLRTKPIAPSFVTESRCVGCGNCYQDCPYQAVDLKPRSDGKPFKAVAWVDPNRCVGCGICTGACDSFGQNLPWISADSVQDRIQGWADRLQPGEKQWLLFVCREIRGKSLEWDESGVLQSLSQYRVIEVPCSGYVNPHFIRYALDRGFQGVFIASSSPGACLYREGNRFLQERLEGLRKPTGRFKEEEREKIRLEGYDKGQMGRLMGDLKRFAREAA